MAKRLQHQLQLQYQLLLLYWGWMSCEMSPASATASTSVAVASQSGANKVYTQLPHFVYGQVLLPLYQATDNFRYFSFGPANVPGFPPTTPPSPTDLLFFC